MRRISTAPQSLYHGNPFIRNLCRRTLLIFHLPGNALCETELINEINCDSEIWSQHQKAFQFT